MDMGSENENDLKEYEELANILEERELDFDLINETIDHARILCKIIIKKSRNKLQIVTGRLDNRFYDSNEIRACFEEAINNGLSEIDLVLDGQLEVNGAISKGFRKFAGGINKKEHRKIFNIFSLKEPNKPNEHFYISDDKRTRIEQGHSLKELQSDKPKVHAIVNFNNSKKAQDLSIKFNKLKSSSNIVKV